MATAFSRPDTSGASQRTPAPQLVSNNLAELLHGCAADCTDASLAMASLVEMLRGCAPDHRLNARALLALLEPLSNSINVLSLDLGTANRVSFSNHAHH